MRQKKSGLENLVLITQLGLNVVTPVLICVILGSWIDKKTGLHTAAYKALSVKPEDQAIRSVRF